MTGKAEVLGEETPAPTKKLTRTNRGMNSGPMTTNNLRVQPMSSSLKKTLLMREWSGYLHDVNTHFANSLLLRSFVNAAIGLIRFLRQNVCLFILKPQAHPAGICIILRAKYDMDLLNQLRPNMLQGPGRSIFSVLT